MCEQGWPSLPGTEPWSRVLPPGTDLTLVRLLHGQTCRVFLITPYRLAGDGKALVRVCLCVRTWEGPRACVFVCAHGEVCDLNTWKEKR